jgi:hypothetical protein
VTVEQQFPQVVGRSGSAFQKRGLASSRDRE